MAVATTSRSAHPPGLYVLFFTELWERYSFYSMMAILSLYMNEALHFDVAHVGRVYGLYNAGVYLMPLAGGLLADRWLGFTRAIIVGGVLMMFGHLVLGVEALPFFYSGLVLLACGSGLLKPNVSTLVGNLYRDRPALRDQGFNIYYMGVNIGAFISPLTVSWLRTHYGWSVAFMSAAVAMALVADHIRHVQTLCGRGRREGRRAVGRGAEPCRRRGSFARDHAARDLRHLARVLDRLLPDLLHVHVLGARQHRHHVESGNLSGLRAARRDPAVAGAGRDSGRGCSGGTPSRPRRSRCCSACCWSRSRSARLVYAGSIGGDTGRVSPLWLIAANVLIALGEISLSPMGMSLVNRLSPPQLRGLMMGGWFASLGIGGYLSGRIGGYWDLMPHSQFFLMVVGILAVVAIPLSLLTPQIKRTMARAERDHSQVGMNGASANKESVPVQLSAILSSALSVAAAPRAD